MSGLIYHYPIDLTGRSSTNMVNNEPHLLVDYSGVDVCVFRLNHGGFYTKDLYIHDSAGKELKPYQDYVATFTYEDLSNRTGLEVCGAIIVTNPDITGTIYVTARMVGGDIAITMDVVEQVLQHLRDHPEDPIVWGGIVGVPTQYGPGELKAELWTKKSYTSVNVELAHVATAISAGDPEALDVYRQHARTRSSDFIGSVDAMDVSHYTDTEHPHKEDKEQIGLGELQNYPPSTAAQATAGVHEESYMTPQQTTAAINARALQPLQQHAAEQGNVHNLTTVQLGVPTKTEVDDLFRTKLNYSEVAYNPSTPGYIDPAGRGPINATDLVLRHNTGERISLTGFINHIRHDIPAGNLVDGLVDGHRLGLGTPTSSTILRGDGRWTAVSQLVSQYAPGGGTKVHYMGVMTTHQLAQYEIGVNYSSITQYPVGTIVLYKLNTETQFDAGHNEYPRVYRMGIYGFLRQSSGWIRYDQISS